MARVEYWLQIENQMWDLSPNGMDRMSGENFSRDANGLFKPFDALIIRRYAPNWSAPDDRRLNAWDLQEPDPTQTRGTIPGATIEAKVGDEIIIHFRNMDLRANVSEMERTHSFHAHGLSSSALYDGTYPLSPPDPSQNGKRGDRVAPGDNFDYHFTVPHASNAGVWVYHDHSIAHMASVLRGAFGAIIVRGGGEMKANLPAQPIRGASDTATNFANVPQPPPTGEHLFFMHELAGVGECVNGKQGLGNTPSFLARMNTRIKFRVVNLTSREQTFHIHGHRWQWGNDWIDTQVVGVASGITVEMLEGTAENGGGNGEWLVVSHNSHALTGSLVVTEGGALALATGAMPMMPDMPNMPDDERHH